MHEPVSICYTVFNKAHLLPNIAVGILESFQREDEVIFLLDQCTDNSSEVLHALDKELSLSKIFDFKIINSSKELFEISANNFLLKEAKNETIILFQDDMVCHDKEIKEKILKIQLLYGDDLGLLGGRDGFELNSIEFPEKPIKKISSWVHKESDTILLQENEFAERTFLNRGPLVFTKSLIEIVGYLNEDLDRQWGDDLDYCARSRFLHNKKNVVFQCNIESRLEWGSTRKGSKLKKEYPQIMRRNWNHFISKYGKYL